MSERVYVVHVTQADIDRTPADRLGLSPLARKLRRLFGSTTRLLGPRLFIKNRPSALCLDDDALKWQEQWEAGLKVGPALCWLASRPAVPRPEQHKAAVRRVEP